MTTINRTLSVAGAYSRLASFFWQAPGRKTCHFTLRY